MNIKDEIIINQFGQDVINIDPIINQFNILSLDEKRSYLKHLVFYFIIQSKPNNEDIITAIKNSGLRSTYTPCVLLRKGIDNQNLTKIIELPEYEMEKILILFLSLFKIAYNRKYLSEKNNPDKWWYWDLSDEKTVKYIIENK